MAELSDHRPATPLTAEQLKALEKWPTPAISNAIEALNIRSLLLGYTNASIQCRFPELGVRAGYAATGKIRASIPAKDDPANVDREVWIDHILTVPGPRIAVLQDLDQPAVGSYWGEVQANRHRALGCAGVITDGAVRDLDEMREAGFQALSGSVLLSRAYMHMVEVGGPVTVAGLTVHSGDLVVMDQHGAIQVPHEVALEIADIAQRLEDEERTLIAFYNSPDYPGIRAPGK